jgi:hypothetical protein
VIIYKNQCYNSTSEVLKTNTNKVSRKIHTDKLFTIRTLKKQLILTQDRSRYAVSKEARKEKSYKPSQMQEQPCQGWDICPGGSATPANNALGVKPLPTTNGGYIIINCNS